MKCPLRMYLEPVSPVISAIHLIHSSAEITGVFPLSTYFNITNAILSSPAMDKMSALNTETIYRYNSKFDSENLMYFIHRVNTFKKNLSLD